MNRIPTNWERLANERIAANHDPVLRASREATYRLLIAFAMLILVAVCWGLGLEVTNG